MIPDSNRVDFVVSPSDKARHWRYMLTVAGSLRGSQQIEWIFAEYAKLWKFPISSMKQDRKAELAGGYPF